MNEELLSEGLTLMMLGMGFVFLFLLFLVFMTQLMSKIVARLEKNQRVTESPVSTSIPTDTNTTPTHDELIAVLTAAVHHHRAIQLKQNARG
ncbi:OadG family protein [Celerinatantimonas diazotrophica]|uniref:Probable oxaloacetate decarboxylase gamma chain n=1 Tax=Celerinatantimonas diazotrophica TaxID=412034 RepID=A0A4R1K7F8_9GAMM|nr:OadG family transporter subunit [Celerinatantimonas diazotrophica]TCK58999.1 oxaloacetate decarboxylase gamma subunit [Celerinatantimonas diazotrophica]CAG9297634.1 oxaloacetate decarboxylase gamma chain [Celerinatantimonas diazotrophica]